LVERRYYGESPGRLAGGYSAGLEDKEARDGLGRDPSDKPSNPSIGRSDEPPDPNELAHEQIGAKDRECNRR
jgi:hypothetical protein